MNKYLKIIIIIFGAIEKTFSMISPLFLTLLLVRVYPQETLNQVIILMLGFGASIHRGLKEILKVVD